MCVVNRLSMCRLQWTKNQGICLQLTSKMHVPMLLSYSLRYTYEGLQSCQYPSSFLVRGAVEGVQIDSISVKPQVQYRHVSLNMKASRSDKNDSRCKVLKVKYASVNLVFTDYPSCLFA